MQVLELEGVARSRDFNIVNVTSGEQKKNGKIKMRALACTHLGKSEHQKLGRCQRIIQLNGQASKSIPSESLGLHL
jgi:hypothetical protein